MQNRLVWWSAVFGVLALAGALQAEEASPQPEPLRVTLALSDGSKVIGRPDLAALPLQTEFAKMEIPFARIAAVKFTAGATNAAVTLANGDKLSAVPGVAELRLTTIFGKVSIPLQIATGLTVSPGGASAVPREGLILWFPFDGAQGAEVADASERGHTGKLFHGARIVADEGRRRDVLELDGGGAHLRVPGAPDFALTNSTLTIWLKPAQWNCHPHTLQPVASTATADGADGGVQFLIIGDHRVYWEGRYADRTQILARPMDLEFSNDADWHFLAVTSVFEEGNYVTCFYCDGKLLQRGEEAAHGPYVYKGQTLYLGSCYDSPYAGLGRDYPREYEGRMDDLMLFNRALSEPEIAALYAAQK